MARGRIFRFPIDLRRRPYNTLTTVRVCDGFFYRTVVVGYFHTNTTAVIIRTRRPILSRSPAEDVDGVFLERIVGKRATLTTDRA